MTAPNPNQFGAPMGDNGYMEQDEEWEREGLLDPAWEKQQRKVSSNLFKLVQTCSNLFKLVQTCAKRSRPGKSLKNCIQIQFRMPLWIMSEKYKLWIKNETTTIIKLELQSIFYTCPNMSEIFQICQNFFQHVQSYLNLPKLV